VKGICILVKEFKGYKKGINLGGWISQCGYYNYTKEHYDEFIHESDIKKIAEWKCDHVRLPFDYNVIQHENGEMIHSGFEYIDNCVQWCKKHNLNLILDLHKAAGFSFDEENFAFFCEPELQEYFYKLWNEISLRYGSLYETVSFELLNEVTDMKYAESWNKIAQKTIEVIRNNAPHTKIIVGGAENNSVNGMALLDKPHDENIVFTFHFYSPIVFTHQKACWIPDMPDDYNTFYPDKIENYQSETKRLFDQRFSNDFLEGMSGEIDVKYFEDLFSVPCSIREKYNVPIYCGEYGVIEKVDESEALKWFDDITATFSKLDIGHAIWNYKGKDFGITDTGLSEFIDKII